MTLQGVDIGGCRKPFSDLSKEGKKLVEQALKKVEAWL
jgi:dihydrodipicolinate synthase/N-acetylneuraminate lyase